MTKCIALIVAAGRGHRFGGELPKQYTLLAGRPVLRYSLEAFGSHPLVDAVRVVIHPDDRDLYDAAAEGLDILEPVPGGASRQDSVRLGLESIADLQPSLVLIHDGARPFADEALITRTIKALTDHPGALPCLAVTDTIKRGSGGLVETTVDRGALLRAQTPQGFRFADILKAHRAVIGEELTDDAAVAERAGLSVAVVEGSEENVKLTTAGDLQRGERKMRGETEIRTGMGIDAHRFTEGDHVMLCGISIPHSHALKGHSDADVALHALTDALLGAVGEGDIGSHFPPSDERWRGVESEVFLYHAAKMVREKGGTILNMDVTIICETPKIGPHRAAMVAKVAEILGIKEHRVSVKGTTTEGLGFTGRSEGIAAQAVATVRL